MASPSGCQGLVEQPRGEHHLEEIVVQQDLFQFERFTIFHELGTEDLDEVGVKQADEESREWTAHHCPVIDPWIALVVHQIPVAVVHRCHKLRHRDLTTI